MARSSWSRWDGTQNPDDSELGTDELIDEISDDVLSGLTPGRAVQRLMRRGIAGRTQGMDELARRIRQQRKRWAERTNLQGPLDKVRERLDEILGQERETLAASPGDEARSRETTLDLLPRSTAGAIRELLDYPFMNPDAQRSFDELIESVKADLLKAQLGQLMSGMQSITPDDVARLRQMFTELNQMIESRNRGEPYDFEGFMTRYGDMFPDNPKNLDQLLEGLARRMAAMSRFLASLSPDQRRELEQLSSALMNDLDLEFEMAMLGSQLQALMPNLPWGEPAYGNSDGSMDASGAVDAFERLGEMEELEQTLKGGYPGAGIQDVDEDQLRRALGDEAVRDLRSLKQIEKLLEESGVMARQGGRLELTARGIRRLGERALVKVFEVLHHDRAGGHQDRQTGGAAEPTGATRPWRFEDQGQISVQRTIFNAVTRSAGTRAPDPESAGRRRPGHRGLRIEPEDFELIEAESATITATALLLDLSFSMPLRGHWVSAKKMALALHSLIEGRYPQDHLYLIGFSDYARKLDLDELTASGNIERVYGTNMQHAFLLARRLLAEHPGCSKQVIMVTDGEPTAHLVEAGPGGPHAVFNWPPTSETIHKTLAEAARLSAAGITLNIYMLEEEPGLTRFMDELAKRTGGRVFHAAGEDIGQFVLRDYVQWR
jgi:uncharacterized protein with von Willebrand factor type A (vWA) domain